MPIDDWYLQVLLKEEIRSGLQSLLAEISKHDDSLNSSIAHDESQSLSVNHTLADEEDEDSEEALKSNTYKEEDTEVEGTLPYQLIKSMKII